MHVLANRLHHLFVAIVGFDLQLLAIERESACENLPLGGCLENFGDHGRSSRNFQLRALLRISIHPAMPSTASFSRLTFENVSGLASAVPSTLLKHLPQSATPPPPR